ncbi:hypothetical protein VE03_06634 [Pseudogymnoascus sp. 23342-1-I1]|nr:hypothetical protein VE03_06634 [Pseudogymnoascus sp. 23342-1-I1]
MAARKKGTVFRVTGLPAAQPDDELNAALNAAIDDNLADKRSKLTVNAAIVPSCYNNDEKVALVEFHGGVPAFLSELMANPLRDWEVEMGDIDISFDQHFFGFTQLYTPKLDSPATADIIAITGLNGHAYGSWRGKGNLGRMWLRDFLSKDLPCCRTMIYGYNSKLSTHGVDTIMDYGRGLIEELKKVRNTEELRKRPLFFIAHSFGGIILAHCLIKAVQADEDDQPTIASLYRATYGMLLFGIPHKGIIVDDIKKMVAGHDNHPRNALLEQIRSKSDLLEFQLVDFRNLIRDRKVVSFYEMGQTRQLEFDTERRRWRRTGDFITAVDADSALLQLPDSMEDKIPLDADHSVMVKFDNKSSRGYTSARDKLRQFEQDAPSVIAARFCTQLEDFLVVFSLSGVHDIKHFVAREAELSEMRRELSGDGSRRTVILHGLGGIGKTQLSVAYAKRHKDSYSAIFWLNIKDEDSIKQSFAKIAKQISRDHPSTLRFSKMDINESLDEVIDAVKAWLSRPNNTRWLMIFDNYDNPKLPSNSDPTAVDIQKFLPESYQGSIIITTRSSHVRTGHSIQIQKLRDVRDSLEILSNVSRREGLRSDPNAIMLARELDGLPLALATAGAYLDQVAVSVSDYLRLYKQSWVQLQKSSPELDSYDTGLYSTWQISFDHVKKQNDLSARLLCFWAYFDSQDLWLELLQHCDSNDPDWVRELTKDELSFHQAVRVLTSHGLVEVDASSQDLIESRGYSIHGCVHSWTIHVLNQVWDHELARLAMKFIGSHAPEEQTGRPWLTQRRLLQHAMRCSYMVLNSLIPDDDIARECNRLGILYGYQVKLVEAEQMFERALQSCEKAWDPGHASTVTPVNNLGSLYTRQGRLVEAEQMYQRALQVCEKEGGLEHELTLFTVKNIGDLYKDQGKLVEAEQMYQRALQGFEKAWGPEHTLTLDTVNSLGVLYAHQGKLVEAEQMYQRALQGKEKAWGLEHISTLSTVNDLGKLCLDQGKLVEAEQMYQRALQGYEKAWGPEHVSTLNTINSLGILYPRQGKLVEAEQMLERALHGKEKALGPEHKSTLNTVYSLGILYKHQGRLVEAEQMCERALQGFEKAWGPEHESTHDTASNLGILYKDQGKLVEAEQMYQLALQGYEKAWGPEHTSTLDTVNNLGNLYKSQGKLVEAKQMYQRALQGYEKALGPDHPTSQSLQEILQGVDFGNEKEPMKGLKEPASGPREEVLRLGSEGALSTSRRHNLFRKLGLR